MIRKVKLCLVIMLMVVMFVTASAEGLFPEMNEMFGTAMPSVGLAIGRAADEQTDTDIGFQEIYRNFTEDEYLAFGQYLAGIGASVKEYTSDGSIMSATISVRDSEMVFSYDLATNTGIAVYPTGTRAETELEVFDRGDSILLITTVVVQEMPRISTALAREASSSEILENGSLQETYLDFSETDYNTFSQFLQKTGCELENYNTDENGVLVINLVSSFGKMTFFYDALHHIGIAEYPNDTTMKKALAITPTPAPEATPEPEKETKYYSANECWRAAYRYFTNLSWKNPQSLTIHDHTTSYTDDGYLFTIDYSAQNGFGGMNRNYYWITVDALTCKVTAAFGSD